MRLIGYEQLREKLGGNSAPSRRTIEQMIARGEFVAPVRVSPGRVAFIESEVDAWLETRRRAPRGEPTALTEWLAAQRKLGIEPKLPRVFQSEAFRALCRDILPEDVDVLVHLARAVERLGAPPAGVQRVHPLLALNDGEQS